MKGNYENIYLGVMLFFEILGFGGLITPFLLGGLSALIVTRVLKENISVDNTRDIITTILIWGGIFFFAVPHFMVSPIPTALAALVGAVFMHQK